VTRKYFFRWTIVLLCSAHLLGACGDSTERIPVRFFNDQHQLLHEFSAELALNSADRAKGLMFRRELGADRGMLFVFQGLSTSPFCMQNTLIPLDMIFIDPQKKIVSIVERAEPQTTVPREPAGPYQYVLEVEGGRSEALGIKAGDSVEFSLP